MKTPIKSRKKSKKLKNQVRSPEASFNEALERYQRFIVKNEKFEQDILALIERVSPQIEACEIQKFLDLQTFTHTLIPFFSKKSLPDYLREELFDCICENVDYLTTNPYTQHLQITELEAAFNKHRNQHLTHSQEKQLKKLEKDGCDPQEIEQLREFHDQMQKAETPEELEQLYKEALGDDEDDFDDDLFESLFEDDIEMDSEFDPFSFDSNDSDEHKPLNQLFKQSSINKLFRRIAKVIHPDLVQDEKQKILQNSQMSKLIEARDNKDIAYILNAYKETFGQFPDTFPDEDYTNLTKVLRHMTDQLTDQKFEILEKIPFGHTYHDLFYRNKPQKEAAAIREHIKLQKQASKKYDVLSSEITSIAKLKEFLSARMQFNNLHYDAFNDNLGDDIPF